MYKIYRQVSYNIKYDYAIIESKNVFIAIRNKNDIEFYKNSKPDNRIGVEILNDSNEDENVENTQNQNKINIENKGYTNDKKIIIHKQI